MTATRAGQCATGKRIYRTHRKAIIALDRIRARKRRMIWPFRRTEQRAYACPFCNQWHLTSQPLFTRLHDR